MKTVTKICLTDSLLSDGYLNSPEHGAGSCPEHPDWPDCLSREDTSEEKELVLVEFQNLQQRFPPHFHSYAVLGQIRSGVQICRIQKTEAASGSEKNPRFYQTVCLKPKDLILFLPGQIHECLDRNDLPLSYRAIQIPPRLFQKLLAGRKPFFTLKAESSRLFDGLWKDLHENPDRALLALHQFFEKQLELDSSAESDDHSGFDLFHSDVKSALDHIESSLDSPFRLETLYQKLHISHSQFYRQWNQVFFISPVQYRNCLRLNRSEKLLCQGYSQSQAAAALQWCEQSELSRLYRQIHGYTPGQRQKARNLTEDGQKHDSFEKKKKAYGC